MNPCAEIVGPEQIIRAPTGCHGHDWRNGRNRTGWQPAPRLVCRPEWTTRMAVVGGRPVDRASRTSGRLLPRGRCERPTSSCPPPNPAGSLGWFHRSSSLDLGGRWHCRCAAQLGQRRLLQGTVALVARRTPCQQYWGTRTRPTEAAVVECSVFAGLTWSPGRRSVLLHLAIPRCDRGAISPILGPSLARVGCGLLVRPRGEPVDALPGHSGLPPLGGRTPPSGPLHLVAVPPDRLPCTRQAGRSGRRTPSGRSSLPHFNRCVPGCRPECLPSRYSHRDRSSRRSDRVHCDSGGWWVVSVCGPTRLRTGPNTSFPVPGLHGGASAASDEWSGDCIVDPVASVVVRSRVPAGNRLRPSGIATDQGIERGGGRKRPGLCWSHCWNLRPDWCRGLLSDRSQCVADQQRTAAASIDPANIHDARANRPTTHHSSRASKHAEHGQPVGRNAERNQPVGSWDLRGTRIGCCVSRQD